MSPIRKLAGFVALATVVWSCGDGTTTPPTPVPTTLNLSTTTLTFNSLNETAQLTPTILDQNGQTLAGQTVAWATTDGNVASVSSSGLVTATGNGTATITATSGSLSKTVAVSVQQVAAALVKTAGDAQTDTVGQALPTDLEVQVNDGGGSGIASATVAFAVTAGGGSLSVTDVTVGADGRGSTSWTLGTVTGAHAVSVTVQGTSVSESFGATAVADAPDTLAIVSGDGQIGVEGAPLADSLVVRVVDQFGNAVEGASVDFTVVSGGGSMSPTTVASDAAGQAASEWTLGATTGTQDAGAAVDGFNVAFTATATSAPANVAVFAGDNQMATVNTAVAVAPAVQVTDAAMQPVQGVEVVFEATGGGGSVTGDTATTDVTGVATVGSWTLGTTAGAQELTATVTGATPAVFTATATAAAAAAMAVAVGDNQTGLVGYAVNRPPAVTVTDQFGNPVANETVNFAVQTGGGSVSGGSDVSDAAGLAQVGSWTLGPSAGSNTLQATSGGLTPVTFTATGQSAQYDIEVRYIGNTPTAPQQEAFDSATARWQRTLYGDVPDDGVNIAANACGVTGQPAVNETVDDLVIFAKVEPIDGVGGVLGSAGPCVIRGGSLLPTIGVMRFDSADLSNLETLNLLDDVIIHEMSHVLGYGTLWGSGFFNLLRDPSLSGNADPYFVGPEALRTFDEIGGDGYTGGNKVPVENTGGQGTADGHWRETVFGNELLTGFINAGSNPLSVVSAASLADMGYLANYAASDAFVLTFPLMGFAPAIVIELRDDLWRGPLYVGQPSGTPRRVR